MDFLIVNPEMRHLCLSGARKGPNFLDSTWRTVKTSTNIYRVSPHCFLFTTPASNNKKQKTSVGQRPRRQEREYSDRGCYAGKRENWEDKMSWNPSKRYQPRNQTQEMLQKATNWTKKLKAEKKGQSSKNYLQMLPSTSPQKQHRPEEDKNWKLMGCLTTRSEIA